MAKKKKRLLVNLLVLLITLAVFFGAFEVLLRLFWYQNPVWNKYNDYFVYTSNSGQKFVLPYPEGAKEMTVNEKGYMGPVIPYENPGGKDRVFMIGDSFIECFRPGLENCSSTRLQQMLGADYEVIAYGTASWALDNEYKVIEMEGTKYGPRTVIVAYYINDFWDASRDLVFSVDANGSLRDNTPIKWNFSKKLFFNVNQYSYVARFFTDAISKRISMDSLARLMGATSFPRAQELSSISWGVPSAIFYSDDQETIEATYRKADLILAKYRELEEKYGFRLVFAIIPLKEQVSDMRLASLKERFNLSGGFDINLPYDRITGLMKKNGLEVVYDLDAFSEAESALEARGLSLFYENDTHFNPAGQELFARVIYDHVWGAIPWERTNP